MDSSSAATSYLDRLGPYTEEELADMRKRGICPCGVEDAVRYPELRAGRATVPTSPNCPWHIAEYAAAITSVYTTEDEDE